MKEFKKYFKIQASVQDVYNAIVNPNMIELWTGDDVVMDDQVGTEFSLYEGNISGKNNHARPKFVLDSRDQN